jgi:transcriptional regulator with XRE-family HTH domain
MVATRPVPLPPDFGDHLRRLIRAANMNQREFAGKLGVHEQTITNWVRGETVPDIDYLPDMAKLLGVTTDAILRPRETQTLENRLERVEGELRSTREALSGLRQAVEALDSGNGIRPPGG